jgi:hypothetical protein
MALHGYMVPVNFVDKQFYQINCSLNPLFLSQTDHAKMVNNGSLRLVTLLLL